MPSGYDVRNFHRIPITSHFIGSVQAANTALPRARLTMSAKWAVPMPSLPHSPSPSTWLARLRWPLLLCNPLARAGHRGAIR